MEVAERNYKSTVGIARCAFFVKKVIVIAPTERNDVLKICKSLLLAFLTIVGTLFISDTADAAEVLKKTTELISSPKVANNKVTFTVSGNVKLVRHAKSLNSSFKPTDVTGGTKSRTRITGFAYSCPGYYTTRVYSDVSGTKLLGYIQVYVSTTDIKNSKCDSITPPPTPTPPTPPAPKPTHPDPLKAEVLKPAPKPTPQKYETQVAINEPETKPPTPTQPEPLSWDKYCEQFNDPTLPGTKHKPMPVAKEGETYPPCCPTSGGIEIFNKSNLPPDTTTFSVSSYDFDVGDWICGKIMDESFDIEDTYCPSNQIYDSSTNQCKVTDNSRENYARITYTNDLVFEGHLYEPEPEPVEEEQEEPTEQTEGHVISACIVEGELAYKLIVNGDDRMPYGYTKEDLKTTGGLVASVDYRNVVRIYEQHSKEIPDTATVQLLDSNVLTGKQLKATTALCPGQDGDIEEDDGPIIPPIEEPPFPPVEEPQPIDCTANPMHEECVPDCYCPTLDAMGPGLGFLCCVWDCPGLSDIISDFKGFLSDDLVGTATAPPVPGYEAGDIPNIFDILNDVDKNTPEPITTTEDPGLEDASFDSDDLKMGADEIEFREDPTGGFDIKNPLDTLPEDGSEAPRPNNMDEQIQYPQRSKGSSDVNADISYPQSNSGSVTPPTGGGSATPPDYSDTVKYPTPN